METFKQFLKKKYFGLGLAAGFILLLTLIAGCTKKVQENSEEILFYRHPMNPSVTSPVPAKDEMGMAYIPVRKEAEGKARVKGEIYIASERQQKIGVKTAQVEKRNLTVTLHTVGHAGYDPDFYKMLEEYKMLISQQRSYERRQLNKVREEADNLLELIKLKLRLAGLSEEQIRQLIVYGQRSENLVLPADATWVYADIYEQDSSLVKPGMKASLIATAIPGEIFEGTIRSADAILYAMSRTVRVRIEMEGENRKMLKPGMTLHVQIKAELGERLAIPEGSVLHSGARNLAFVDLGEGRLQPREVQAGYAADGYDEILSGLSEGEIVIASANFLIDSESNLQAALKDFGSAEGMKNPSVEGGHRH